MESYEKLPDTTLVLQLQTGDESAFTAIYHRYWEKLITTAYFFTQQKQHAEDIVHDVMMSLWLRRSTLEIHNLQAYLATAVKFAVFKSIVKQKRRNDILAGLFFTETEEDLSQMIDMKFDEAYINGIIEHLPQKAMLVFRYSRHDNLSVKEIAGKLKVSDKAIEYHLTKALNTLRDAFNKIKLFFI